MTAVIGWYVRVRNGVIVDEVYDTVLYIAGYPTPEEAVTAVKAAHSGPGIEYEAVGSIAEGRGPQPKPGEVRHLVGAV
jgi:hypothetical protein